MLKELPDTPAGKRDRALLCLGFSGAFRRSELVSLEVADLTKTPDGFRVLIRKSKTDPTGEGEEIAIPRGFRLRPVAAVQTWLEAAGIAEGQYSGGSPQDGWTVAGGRRLSWWAPGRYPGTASPRS
jgi:hypothetical protein